MAMLLEVEDLGVRFPKLDAVRGLNFAIQQGQTMALVGESGSGKSMTAMSLMRLVPRPGIISGSIRFDGRDLLALPEPELRKVRGRDISMIFQEPMTSLNPVKSIGHQIAETIRLHERVSARGARARAIELLDLVRIAEPHKRVDDYPHHLSGGMRQRAMIAMAVACRPRLLIADEPTTALDVTIQAQVLDLLDSLRREMSMALLLITHDLGIVRQWADDVIVLYAGRQVEEGPAEAVLKRPLHPYTRGLLAASPQSAANLHYRQARLVEIPGSIASAKDEPGCPFAPRCLIVEPGCRISPPALLPAGKSERVACPVVLAEESRYAAAAGRL